MAGTDRRKRTGQILVIILLGILLLGGLVFYVVNAGTLLNRRVEMQNAADSAAISGAAFMARSMNMIGMNNVAQTRMLALVPHLDAFPLSCRMGHEETAAWDECLKNQLARGVPDQYLKAGLESLQKRMARQRNILGPMDHYLNSSGFDMATLTTWSIRGHGGPEPHGTLWQAFTALGELSEASAESAGVLAQANAARHGRRNGAEVAFVVPILPELPYRRASFYEFERPVKNGLIPDRAWPQRLGPYDRLFKWRDYRSHNIRERDRLVPGRPGHGPTRGGSGVNPGGRRNGRSARGHGTNPREHWSYKTVGRILLGYRVYGPFEWMRRRIYGYSHGWWQRRGYYAGQLSDTFFHDYHKNVSTTKLGYMWGSQTPKYIHYPQWHTDYPTARTLALQPHVRVTRTMYYLVEVRSRYPKGHASYLSPGTFVTNGDVPIAMWLKGWKDADKWKLPRTGDYVWEDQYTYETTEDWDIGIRKKRDPRTGQDEWQKVYMIAQYVFGGIDVGGEWQITNPANYTDRGVLPVPLLLDTAAGDYDVSQPHHDLGVRRQQFTYLGVAGRNSQVPVWGRKFGSGNPSGSVTTVSQAIIFNTTSWGLWTQDWKAKLVPVSRWGDWMGLMAAGADDAAASGGLVDDNAVLDVHEYLSRFPQDLVDAYLHH